MGYTGQRRKGISFPFVMFLSVLLFVTGLGFLGFVQRDARLQLRAHRANAVFTLARSGLDYYTFHTIETPGIFPVGELQGPFELDPGHFFEITANSDGGCTCRGWIESSNKVVADRTLVIPGNHIIGGDRTATFDPSL
jgi:hypothetical protein